MIYSDRLLFLHVPKAGGSSIVQYLMDVLPKPVYYSLPADHSAEFPPGVTRFPGVAHETLDEARVVLARRGLRLEDFPVVVACIRNPYELEVSRYFFLRSDLNRYNHGVQQAVALLGDFEMFATYSRPHGFRPLETYFLLDGLSPPNLRIVRLENVDAELGECLAAAGVGDDATLVPRYNRSQHDSFTTYYTPAAEQAVYEKYKWIFKAGLYPRRQLADDQVAPGRNGGVGDGILASVAELDGKDDFALANAWLATAEIHRHTFRNDARYEALERALSHAQQIGSVRLTRTISVELAECLSLGGPHAVGDGIEQWRALFPARGGTRGHRGLVLAELLAATGQFEEARSICQDVKEAGKRRDVAAVELLAAAAAGSVELLAGDEEAAAACFRHGCPWRPLSFVGHPAEALYRLGRYEETERLATSLETTAAAGDAKAQVQWRRTRAKLLARAENADQALQLAQSALALIARCEAPNVHADTLVDVAEVLHRGGRAEEAIAALDEAAALYDRKGNVVSSRATHALRDARMSGRDSSHRHAPVKG